MIIELPYPKSSALENEIEALEKFFSEYLSAEYFKKYPTPCSYYDYYMNTPVGLEFKRHVNNLNDGASILEVGPGAGQTTVYLAEKGFDVTVVEPSPDACRVIETATKTYGFEITIYTCTAEYMNNISDRFDVISYNASFHHCDNPQLALQNSYRLLNKGGLLILANEPILAFFKTKSWYQNKFKKFPLEMGDYGGNEHIYYHHEYLKMIKSVGFLNVDSRLHIIYNDYNLKKKQLNEQNLPYNQLFCRKLWFYIIFKLINRPPIGQLVTNLMKNLSLLTTTFMAVK